MSNLTGGDDGSFSSGNTGEEVHQEKQQPSNFKTSSSSVSAVATNSNGSSSTQQQTNKKKRNLPGNPDPTAEVIALSPTTLMATNRFVCEICNKGFQRDQNLQLHRRGHNLPWKLRQRTTTEIRKRVYICPEPSCVHHNPARALGDLTGIKKHYSRKHGEKKWKCDKCSKKYAVQSDWKAHQKTCGTREYKCDCGTIFSRRDSFITHRAFCDALAEENNKVNQNLINNNMAPPNSSQAQMMSPEFISTMPMHMPMPSLSSEFNTLLPTMPFKSPMNNNNMGIGMFSTSSGTLFGSPKTIPNSSSSSSSGLQLSSNGPSNFNYLQEGKNGNNQISGGGGGGGATAQMSATALLQKAAQMGATASNNNTIINSPMMQQKSFMVGPNQISVPSGSLPRHHHDGYEAFQHQHQQAQSAPPHPHEQQTDLAGGINQIFQKNSHEINQLFESGSGNSSAMNDLGMFGGILMGSTAEQFNENDHIGLMPPAAGRGSMNRIGSPAVVGGGNSRIHGSGGDVMTVDFLGIGGGSIRPQNLHEQQQQRMEMEVMSQHRMQVMNPFHQQLSHGIGEPPIEKPLWDV